MINITDLKSINLWRYLPPVLTHSRHIVRNNIALGGANDGVPRNS